MRTDAKMQALEKEEKIDMGGTPAPRFIGRHARNMCFSTARVYHGL